MKKHRVSGRSVPAILQCDCPLWSVQGTDFVHHLCAGGCDCHAGLCHAGGTADASGTKRKGMRTQIVSLVPCLLPLEPLLSGASR